MRPVESDRNVPGPPAADGRPAWAAPRLIALSGAGAAANGSITTYPEGAPTPFGGTGVAAS